MTLFPLRSVLALSLLFSLTACTDGSDGKDGETGDGTSDEVCDNGTDDDGDGVVDCEDTDCAGDAACEEPPGPESACADGLDDDGDGDIDCEDTDCADDAACEELTEEVRCADGADDDGDGAIDCDDTDCADDQACAPPAESICDDATDNDGDGATDCDDNDCADDPACATATSETVCDDTLDDDGDGAIDCDDDDCAGDPACAAPATEVNCDDGIDDDGDRAFDCEDADCAADPACAVAAELSCADGLDDDGDGAIDCDDADCVADAACTGTVAELICDDGLDDDGDGLTDCDDTDCAGAEACATTPGVCGETDLGSAYGAAVASGTLTGAGDDYDPEGCGGDGGEDVSFTWTAPVDGDYRISTIGSDFDTLIVLLSDDCTTEMDCDDDGAGYPWSEIEFSATAGEAFTFSVQGYSSSSTGTYQLNVDPLSEIDCRDGGDEDVDGAADCEDSDCADDAACMGEPACDDGTDEDGDGLTDCDDDDCAEALACTHPCVDDELGGLVGTAVATGTTAGEGDDYAPTCASGTAGDVAYLWTAPADGSYTFSTAGSGFDTVLVAQSPDCTDTEIECHDSISGDDTSSEVSLSMTIGQSITLVIDGVDGASGDYVLNVAADMEVDCDDGGDEDSDGYLDCEDIDCVGVPVCSPEGLCEDGRDDDLDGSTDCLDTDCGAAPECDVSSADTDLGSATGRSLATGTTVGAVDDGVPSCGYSSGAEDLVFAWVAPTSATYTFDLSGSSFDTLLMVSDADGTSLACDDDSGDSATSLTTAALRAGQLVFVHIDGYSSGSGSYVLSIY